MADWTKIQTSKNAYMIYGVVMVVMVIGEGDRLKFCCGGSTPLLLLPPPPSSDDF